ncbi:hypothetical protein [Chondromyces crocatus]|uniref:Uncharacterized protein n=1 Tax=Chondromyces crocatus TaxID=52 RepID=A0A0K1EPW1_CHOCO|nr:hypothetical protein [Chondromyces crocatus]AKT42965.1 uncharacterized protein CMC5_071930 [Chondromyces crocatus]
MASTAKKLTRGSGQHSRDLEPEEQPPPAPRLVEGEEALRVAQSLRPEEREDEPESVPEERRGLEERRVDTRLEGLSGMGAVLGEISEDKDQLGHVERQGLRREEQAQIERLLDPDELH